MNALSKREKAMLGGLAYLLAGVAGFGLLISPAAAQYMRLYGENLNQSMREQSMRQTIEDADAISAGLALAREEVAAAARVFYAPMPTEDVDEMITVYLDGNGLVNEELEIVSYEPVEVGEFVPAVHTVTYPYKLSLLDAGEPLEGSDPVERPEPPPEASSAAETDAEKAARDSETRQLAELSGQVADGDQEIAAEVEALRATVLRCPMTLHMFGTIDGVTGFVDDISREKPVQVTSLTMEQREGGAFEFFVELDVYMLDRI